MLASPMSPIGATAPMVGASLRAIDLVVTDLDGTLWRTEREVHPRVRAAWAELNRRGVPILAASGRRVASMRSSLGRYGWRPPAVA